MKRIITLILAVSIIMSLGILPLYAEGAESTPSISAQNVNIAKGETFSISLNANNFSNVGAVNFSVFYDADIFSVISSSSGSLVSGSQVSVNTENKGEILFNCISANGITGSGDILNLEFRASDTIKDGKYYFNVAVGEVYDKNLTPLSVSSQKFNVAVASRENNKNITLYSSSSSSKLKVNDIVDFSFYTYDCQGMSAADFEIEYDRDLFALNSVDLGEMLKSANGAAHSINSDKEGYVKISYTSLKEITGSVNPLVKLQLKVKKDCNATTSVSMRISSVYDSKFNSINVNKTIQTLTIEKLPLSLPAITIESQNIAENGFSIGVYAPADGNLAAGDFVLTFDKELECISAECRETNCMLIKNVDNENGIVKFSFICESGIKTKTEMIYLTFNPKNLSKCKLNFSISGKNTVDSNYKEIYYDYVASDVDFHSYESVVTPPTCTEQGYTTHTCKYCGHSYVDSYTEKTCVKIEGSVVSFKDESEIIKIELIPADSTVEAVQINVTGNNTTYSFSNVKAGDYTLRVSKLHHVTRDYIVTVGTENVTQDVKIHLIGDVTGDGVVSNKDLIKMRLHISEKKLLTEYVYQCADISGDGIISNKDLIKTRLHISEKKPLF